MARTVPLKEEHVLYEGLKLPPERLRWGGARRRSDEDYVRSAAVNARTLKRLCGLTRESRVLDIGCGPGRLYIGIQSEIGRVEEYIGLDVKRPVIKWAQANLGKPSRGRARFEWLDVVNERYQPDAATASGQLPIENEYVDIVTLLSVFSHLMFRDIDPYLHEIRRVLKLDGKVYCTAFVEDDVSEEEENPAGYLRESWSGPLHCVRLNRQAFERRAWDAGLRVEHYEHRKTHDGQSTYVLSRRDREATPTGQE